MRKSLGLLAVVVVLGLACAAFAEEPVKIGMPAKSFHSENDFNNLMDSDPWIWSILHPSHEHGAQYIFYDTVTQMISAFNRGDVDEIDVAEPLGNYLLSVNPDYKVSCVFYEHPIAVTFGFLNTDRGRDIRSRFNSAISQLKVSGKLEALQNEYVRIPKYDEIKSAKFDTFEGAETITAAVTGDLPPLDYIEADGEPAGFNTALLSEIGRILKVNIKLINIENAARTAALTSGRADVVFWFMKYDDNNLPNFDFHDEVIPSEPYYLFNLFLELRKSDRKD